MDCSVSPGPWISSSPSSVSWCRLLFVLFSVVVVAFDGVGWWRFGLCGVSLIGDSDPDVVDESDSSKRPLWGSVVVGEEGVFSSKLCVIFGSMVVGGVGGSCVVGVGGSLSETSVWEHVLVGLLDCKFDWLSHCCCKVSSFDGIVLLSGGGGLVTASLMMLWPFEGVCSVRSFCCSV